MNEKKLALCCIMSKVHALADTAWSNDGVSAMPTPVHDAIIDIQIAAAKALGLPDDLDLMTGDPRLDDLT